MSANILAPGDLIQVISRIEFLGNVMEYDGRVYAGTYVGEVRCSIEFSLDQDTFDMFDVVQWEAYWTSGMKLFQETGGALAGEMLQADLEQEILDALDPLEEHRPFSSTPPSSVEKDS